MKRKWNGESIFNFIITVNLVNEWSKANELTKCGFHCGSHSINSGLIQSIKTGINELTDAAIEMNSFFLASFIDPSFN